MSLQGALNFISSGGNIGNKVSKVNIWGPNITNAVNMFNVNSASITDFFAYVPNATDVNGMMNSKALVNADLDIGEAPCSQYMIQNGSNYKSLKLTSNNSKWPKTPFIGTGVTDFTFITHHAFSGDGRSVNSNVVSSIDNACMFYSYGTSEWRNLKNVNIYAPNAINIHVFPNSTNIYHSLNLKQLLYIKIVANNAIDAPGNTTFCASTYNQRNNSKIIEGYLPNVLYALWLFNNQKSIKNIHDLGINYQKLQRGFNMFCNSSVDNVSDTVFGMPTTDASFAQMFTYCNNITTIKNVKIFASNISYMFANCAKVHTIDNMFIRIHNAPTTTSTSGVFSRLTSLKNVTNLDINTTNNGALDLALFYYSQNVESVTNCKFFGYISGLWYNANRTKVHTLKNISLGVPGTTSKTTTGNGFMNSNKLTTVENIYVNFPNNTGNLIPVNMFRNCTNLTSPSNQIFFDVGANAYLDTYNNPPPAWLAGNTDTYIFSGCTNMPDYDLIHANWKK